MTEQTNDAFQEAISNIETLKGGGEVESAPVEEATHEIELEIEGEEVTAEEGEGAEAEGPADELSEALTHGFKPYDEYIAEGNDPDMYRGPKAFVQFKEMKEKLKGEANESKTETAKLRSDMDEMMQMFIDTQKEQKTAEKARLEAALAEATESLDPKAAAEYATQLAKIDDEPEIEVEAAPAAAEVSEEQKAPLVSLINANPALDRTSDKFNQDAADMLSTRLNRRFSGQKDSEITPDRIQAVVSQEWADVQEKLGMTKTRTLKKAKQTPNAAPTKTSSKKSVKLTPMEKGLYEKMRVAKPAAAADYLRQISEREA